MAEPTCTPVAAAATTGSSFTRSAARASQLELPGFTHEIVPEAVVRLLVHQAKPGLLVDLPGGEQDAVGPERELAVAALPREPDALGHEPGADAEAAGAGLDQQQAQPGDGLRPPDHEHRADGLGVLLRDPAALPLRLVVLDELGHDGGHQRLEALVPSVFLGVERAVPAHHPAHVAPLR